VAEINWLIGDSYRRQEQFDTAFEFLTRARSFIAESPAPQASTLFGAIAFATGMVHYARGQYSEALRLYYEPLEISRKNNDHKHVVQLLAAIGDTYRILGDYSNGLDALSEALQIGEQIEFLQGMAIASNNMAIIYCYLQEYENALTSYRRSLDLNRTIGNGTGQTTALINIGTVLMTLGNFEDAAKHHHEALHISREIGSIRLEAHALAEIAHIESIRGDQGRALDLLQQVLTMHEQIGYNAGRAEALKAMGHLFAQLHQWKQSLIHFTAALGIVQEMAYHYLECNLYQELASVEEHLGNYRSSLEHYKQYIELRNELDTQEIRRKLAHLEVRAEVEQAEYEQNRLRRNAEYLQNEQGYQSRELVAMALKVAEHNQFITHLKDEVLPNAPANADGLVAEIRKQIESTLMQQNRWCLFEQHFRYLHEGFLQLLCQRSSELTPAELKVCALLKIKLNSQDIADVLNISVHTVTTHRRRIRKKLSLQPGENLVTFLIEFDAGPADTM
jgi:tetratricopeptide (TPR) repeat protein/DNA-binding CsgD family transcriptional regulator